MTVNRVVAYHVNRLKDKNPEIRMKAIEELKLIAHVDALEPLKEVYNTDANADVRKAAQEAGRIIFLKSQVDNEA